MKQIILVLIILLKIQLAYSGDNDSTRLNKRRFIPLATIVGVGYTGSIIALNELWYKNEPRSSFHFFNDNHEWEQVDKVGHFMTSFQESRYAVDALKWAGVKERSAIWWGSMTGILLQTPIEVLDGFSAAYGASSGDLIANFSGSALVLSQQLAWREIRVEPKFSFHQTRYARINPGLLGSNLPQQIFKDYNGQTYWLSFNIHSFLRENSKFPPWLSVALGYGAQDMVRAERALSKAQGYNVYRQYYLALDVDLTKVKTKSKALRFLFYRINIIHLPSPALEWSKHGIKFHPIYF